MNNHLTLSLKTNNYPIYSDLISILTDYEYLRVSVVLEPGDFSVRGSIIDVFPTNQTHPLRIEYMDNDIDRLNSFDIQTQRSISTLDSTIISENKAHIKTYITEQESTPNLPEIISQFRDGDYIVHEDYGIGVFKGLERRSFGELEGEYIFIQYQGEDKVYVPLTQMNRLHSYGDEKEPTLSGLYDGKWKRATQKALEHTQILARDIYSLYKNRLSRQGFAYKDDTETQLLMESDFQYKLTGDQEKAIHDVKSDMESPKPMDRLICGDVGFGKTEVVLRAAFKAFENLKQVALLCPTTVLAQQHYDTFKSRLEPYGVHVKLMSRLVSKSTQDGVRAELETHRADLVIGTHRLLQPDIVFSDLGLLIVDEEQRFGVGHKEKIKKIKEYVDIVSVSATPIPRTLYMSLNGAKDMSIIATPPQKRKPIICTVAEENDSLIKNAIQRELDRGGQVFFVHNRVQDIGNVKLKLSRLLPSATIQVAHGQMKEGEMIRVMREFVSKKCDILICTTIIENGVDIPNANTIMIQDADNFGLSQIHQLRGRVGRSERQAFAYMLYKSTDALSDKAKRRLQAVKEYLSLGSGYQLALKDLEIRGAGNLLGKEQSGHLNTIGFTLYCKLLENAIRIAKGEKPEYDHWLSLDALKIRFSETYIQNPRERLALYHRMMKLTSVAALRDLEDEVKDRYGAFDSDTRQIFKYLEKEIKVGKVN